MARSGLYKGRRRCEQGSRQGRCIERVCALAYEGKADGRQCVPKDRGAITTAKAWWMTWASESLESISTGGGYGGLIAKIV